MDKIGQNDKVLAWGKKVSPEFREILYTGCKALGWTDSAASKLMACMAFETGETFSPSVKNPRSSATGLIQFMEATAKSLGTSTAKLAQMTPETQLRWVFKYLDQFPKLKGSSATLSDIYMAIFMPSMIGYPNNTPIPLSGSQYSVNAGLDKDKDRVVTKGEAAAMVMQKYERGLTDEFVFIEKY